MSKSRDLGEFPAAALDIDASGAITTTGPIDGRDVSTDGTKLDTIETSADVTDTANVTSSGALMDSELASIASVKALNQGVATTDDPTFTNTHLAAIDATISATAVDTFVYDTRKDSDGGAWRKRTQHTSWYNETLNTSTRGSRKEFPVVAVIVADASSQEVTIYDGDDPAMPMWMVFKRTHGSTYPAWTMVVGSSSTAYDHLTSISALNGVLVAGLTSSANGAWAGITVLNFMTDSAEKVTETPNTLYTGTFPYGIADRGRSLPDGGFAGTSSYGSLVSANVNDVAMTVLPNAPIDPATGLPVPTIALATDGGVSVIKDDGTVVDINGYNTAWTRIEWFDGDNFGAVRSGTGLYTFKLSNITDGVNENSVLTSRYRSTLDSYGVAVLYNSSAVMFPTNTNGNLTVGNVSGVSVVDPNPTNPSKGSVAYITSDYNTGWMNGDIKLATLSDTDATDVVGTELITNGTFDSNATGWSPAGDCTISAAGGKGVGTMTNTAGRWDQSAPVSLNVGDTITYSLFWDSSSTHGNLYLGVINNVGANLKQTHFSSANLGKTVTITYTATYTGSHYLYFQGYYWGGGKLGETIVVDNISARLAEEDRSVNGNGLQVVGTVTKTPVATGADLVGYSGFSTSNYLEQPYNSDLDFGTGDFSIMGWINVGTSVSAYASILSRVLSNNAETNAWSLRIDSSANNYYFYTNNSNVFYSPLTRSTWQFLTVARRSGVVYFYVDGAFRATGLMANTITHVGASVVVGHESTHHIGNSSVALFRVSATAPTAEQIAKIYEAEKPLFQENAQATLYGTSNAVTALAYDDDTELLHAGTSSGRSVFQGLRRVSNTTDAITTSISASNSIIVEE